MNIKAIVTAALVIGSSSLALARPYEAPAPQGGVTVQSTTDVRDHRAADYDNLTDNNTAFVATSCVRRTGPTPPR